MVDHSQVTNEELGRRLDRFKRAIHVIQQEQISRHILLLPSTRRIVLVPVAAPVSTETDLSESTDEQLGERLDENYEAVRAIQQEQVSRQIPSPSIRRTDA